ncbi:MAG: site-specific integrase [Syntrophorhabdaceae bacterium]|nr:site-specific integrase [Syntrophorhabdaceae bacterium]
MPKRFKTKYPGVYYIEGTGTRGPEKIYYIAYRKDGKLIEEKAGRQHKDAMTPARAVRIRSRRIEGKELSNKGRREAAEAARAAEAGKWTIAKLWELYREEHAKMKSFDSDKTRYDKHIKPVFDTKEPCEIMPLDLDRLQRRNLKGRSAATVKHVLSLLGRIANLGLKKHLCQGLSFPIKMPSVDNQITENLNASELSALLKVLEESEDIQAAHFMQMALFTGMRKGELLKLLWSDIDFERSFIFIRKPKGKKSMYIPLNDAARAVLEKHPRIGENVFANRKGEPFKDLRKRIESIRKAAKLPPEFRPLHGLRHVYASILASSGQVDLYTLQRLLTHKSAAMTARYAHLHDEAQKKAAEVASDVFKGVTNG